MATQKGQAAYLLSVTAAVALCTLIAAAQTREFHPVTDDTLRNPSPSDWIAWRGTHKSLGYSALDQINRTNVKQLQLAWSWAMDPGVSESAPIVYEGVMYLPNAGGVVQALDAATGDLLWEYRPQFADGRPRTGAVKGLSIYDDKVFLDAPDARIIALDARTGKAVWTVQVADPTMGFSYDSASVVARGKVMSGLGGCAKYVEEKCAITAHDAATGKELWRTRTIPKPGEPGGDTWGDLDYLYRAGSGMWGAGSYDADLNLVYFWTSGAKPWTRAARGTDGDALFANTTLALDADTGKIVWYRQLTPGETQDLDDGFESILVDTGSRKSLFKMGKLGILWELDRATGKFVNASDLGYQDVVELDASTGKVTYRPNKIPKLNEPLAFCPGTQGVREWQAMAFSPETQAFYIPIEMACMTVAFGNVEKVPGGGGNGDGPRSSFLHPAGGGMLAELLALNTTGKVLWRHRQRAPFTSATVTTGGGLVFVGDFDRFINAYDVKSGELLWQTRASSAVSGFPLSYAVNGRQYVAFPVGAGSTASWFTRLPAAHSPEIKRPPAGNGLMVFALPNTNR